MGFNKKNIYIKNLEIIRLLLLGNQILKITWVVLIQQKFHWSFLYSFCLKLTQCYKYIEEYENFASFLKKFVIQVRNGFVKPKLDIATPNLVASLHRGFDVVGMARIFLIHE